MSTATAAGAVIDMPMAEYLAMPQMSASRLEIFRRSPLQYQYSLTAPPREETPAMLRGTALHMALLEPERFEGHYVTLGMCAGRKKDGAPCGYRGSIYRDGQSFCRTHDPERDTPPDESVTVIPEDEMALVIGMRDAVRAHPQASALLTGAGAMEEVLTWVDEETGVECRMRLDRYVERVAMLLDIKTAHDASPDAFRRQAENLGYWRKMAFYRRGLRATGRDVQHVAILAIEVAPPHDLAPYLLDDDHLQQADDEVTRLLRHYADCLAADEWPGYADTFRMFYRPAWAVRTEEAA